MCVVLLIYTCYGPFYNLFLVWERAAGFAFLSSVLFLVGCSHVLLVLGTANSHFDAQYTRAGAAQQNLSLSHSDPGHTMKFWALWKCAAKQMKELYFIDQIWLLRGKTPVLTSLGPLWICTGEGKRRLWSSEFRRKGTRVNKKDFLANSRMPSSYLVEASGQDQSELLICSQNIFGVVNCRGLTQASN